MRHVRKEKVAYVVPTVEVSLRADGEELAAIAFYDTGENRWDVLVGVLNPADRDNVKAVLRYAADALEQAAFDPRGSARDEDDGKREGKLNDFPF